MNKFIKYTWLGVVIMIILGFVCFPDIIDPRNISTFISSYENHALLVYAIVSILRGFFLIPSTPFVIAGGIIFPNSLLEVLIISMAGVLFSASSLYYFSLHFGFDKKLRTKYPSKLAKLELKLNHPLAPIFVFGWAVFPFVPTDLICYIAGVVRMKFIYLLAGIFIGELILNTIYIYYSQSFSFLN